MYDFIIYIPQVSYYNEYFTKKNKNPKNSKILEIRYKLFHMQP